MVRSNKSLNILKNAPSFPNYVHSKVNKCIPSIATRLTEEFGHNNIPIVVMRDGSTPRLRANTPYGGFVQLQW